MCGLTIIALWLIFGICDEGYDRLWQAHLLKDFTIPLFMPPVWFGLQWIGAQVANFLVLEVIIRRVKLGQSRAILAASMVTNGTLLVSIIIFALAGDFYLAMAACWVGRTLQHSGVFYIWVNRNLDARVRATVLSFGSQVDALGRFLGGPFVGYIGASISIPAALLTSALLLSPSMLFFANTLRLTGKIKGVETPP